MKEKIRNIKWDDLKKRLGLKRLYFIDAVENKKAVFGVRGVNVKDSLVEEIKNKISEILISKNITGMEIEVLTKGYDEVNFILEYKVSSYVKADGGEITIFEIKEEEGLVILSLKGACSGCPHSMYTMSAGIETMLKKYLFWVKDVKPNDSPVEPNFKFNLYDFDDLDLIEEKK